MCLGRYKHGVLCKLWSACFLLLLLSVTCEANDYSKCEKLALLSSLEDHHTVVETTMKLLAGTWISESCETRPGPEYVLRSYSFESDGNYDLIQHHYWDDSCSSPKLTIQSHGRLQLRSSLVQPGASSGFPRTLNVTVMPQDNKAAKELDKIVAKECPAQYWKIWRKYEEHLIYENRNIDRKKTYNLWTPIYQESTNYHTVNSQRNVLHSSGYISCLGSMKWAFNELKLVKIQLRPIMENISKHPKEMKLELLLGDIHSNQKQRELYSPTSFQLPLTKQVKDHLLTINRHVYSIKSPNTIPSSIYTNRKTPPHLLKKAHLPPYIWGEWTSIRCEVRPMSLYLTRRFSFYSADSTWIGEHKFYADPFCTIPKFVVTAAGHFDIIGASTVLDGSTDINIHIEKASLTVMDQRMIYDMRLTGFCGQDKWEVNVPKELSSTRGCMQLSIILPSIQYDIVKVEMDFRGSCLLFLGQADTDNLPSILKERPTAFQLPLIKCGEVATYSQELREILNDNILFSDSNKINNHFVIVYVFSMSTLVLSWFR